MTTIAAFLPLDSVARTARVQQQAGRHGRSSATQP